MTGKNGEEPNDIRLRQAIYQVFNDDLMIALAAILASAVILQLIFEFSSGMEAVFDYLNYFIIIAFVAEYVLKLYVAEQKASFVIEPMHIFDLIIILLALFEFSGIGYVLFLPNQAQLSPILRLLRVLPRILPRVLLTFFLAGRTAKRIKKTEEELPSPELHIAALNLNGVINKDHLSVKIRSIISEEAPIWIDFQNITEDDFGTIENIAAIPRDTLETKLIKASFPRIDPLEKYLTMFLWDSQIIIPTNEHFDIFTNNMLIVFHENKIITLSIGKSQLFEKISSDLSSEILGKTLKKNEFTDRILYSLLQQKLKDYSDVIQKIEQKSIEFEQIPVDKTSSKFLEETFHLKKEILKISGNIWHFQKVLENLAINDNIKKKFCIDNCDEFINLHAESTYLGDTIKNIKESLDSLIELHTNTVSYDLNRVMKVIAVITCLAIIPATVGGLLGVNLDEGTFPIKFIEIFFIIFSSMALSLYAFYKMEWLK